jgi:hypothetical protein
MSETLTKSNGSNFLASIFNWSSEVVESAESPFARLAAFLLPILAPITPAFLTSIRLYKLFLTILLETKLPDWVALIGAIITALVLEILGYVGTIAMVRFIYKWIKTKTDEYLVPTAMTGIAYAFYLGIMYLVNVQLNTANPNTTAIFGLLGFLTIPAGLIFATNLVSSEENKNDYILRQEKREDRLKAKALNAGINVFEQQVHLVKDNSPAPQQSSQSTDWRVVVKTLDPKQIQFIANCNDWKVISKMYNLSERSARNWIGNAQKKLSQ